MEIFKCFYDTHEKYRGEQHFRLHPSQINNIILKMVECEDFMYEGSSIEFSPEDYPALIEDYYSKYDKRNNNDFYKPNIEHFFSGKTRALCFYEACF